MSIRPRTTTSSSSSSKELTSVSNSIDAPPPDSPNIPPPDHQLPPSTTSFYRRALDSTANLANLLPTGTLLAFQLLTPIFTNNGSCQVITRQMTSILLHILAISCFLASFTDSFRASDGQVYYGFATPNGLWIFDKPAAAASGIPSDLSKYRLSFVDFVHSVLSVLVFFAVAFRDKNVITCFYPTPNQETKQVLDIVPIGVGLMCSLLFVIFPTRRHGIGYPVTSGRPSSTYK
ncbi:hypothetical protein M9H77_20958 [Catharanthus roseus]|uniref:Uncharacterized protein n=1 Tax=Catharanthus roseus TaxID=4058 RepID=A0ACC0AMN8_CATRO|nr:hypothetical protein M9H77_20958 [Catharanthus roseus]